MRPSTDLEGGRRRPEGGRRGVGELRVFVDGERLVANVGAVEGDGHRIGRDAEHDVVPARRDHVERARGVDVEVDDADSPGAVDDDGAHEGARGGGGAVRVDAGGVDPVGLAAEVEVDVVVLHGEDAGAGVLGVRVEVLPRVAVAGGLLEPEADGKAGVLGVVEVGDRSAVALAVQDEAVVGERGVAEQGDLRGGCTGAVGSLRRAHPRRSGRIPMGPEKMRRKIREVPRTGAPRSISERAGTIVAKNAMEAASRGSPVPVDVSQTCAMGGTE